jgi:hypothetical protein
MIRMSSAISAAMIGAAVALSPIPATAQAPARAAAYSSPRTPDGHPDLQGIWRAGTTARVDLQLHVARDGMPAGAGVVDGGDIPYQPWAAAKKKENFANRATADPLGKCYFPGVPRINYLDFPFQIYQTNDHVAITYEWTQVYRVIYTDGSKHIQGIEFWMGDSRGHWEGDTLVVEVTDHNDKTWFDMAGDFHSDELRVVERYTRTDPDTIRYEATIEDPKVFTRPWKIVVPLHREKDTPRLLEYQCQAEAEEASGDFPPERTWYPGPATAMPTPPAPPRPVRAPATRPDPKNGPIRRMADGKPNLQGYYSSDSEGANYGLEFHATKFGLRGGAGFIVDPPDHKFPYQPWAAAEQQSRATPERGYDDPAAHCFVYGIPRSTYTSSFQLLQPPGYVVLLNERMSYRSVALNERPHLPDTVRLWQGDSVGRWDGDTLIVDTTNLNGKTWLNEIGEVVSYTEHVVERFTPIDGETIDYEATVSDPLVYTRPWTIAFPLRRSGDEILEVACHEDNNDLQHLKAIKEGRSK